jgi:hypothetical protein
MIGDNMDDNVDDVLIIFFGFNDAVSCLPPFKPHQEEVGICDRHELTYERPAYDPSAKSSIDQEAAMADSRGRLKV